MVAPNQDREPGSYIIRGGNAGAARLHVLGRATRQGSMDLIDRAGLVPGMRVLDLGCGSGDITVELARRVGPSDRVVGIDRDAHALAQARAIAQAVGLSIDWRQGQVEDLDQEGVFDLVYARFLLSHLSDPAAVLKRIRKALKPSGRIVIEDIDISVHAHWPPCPSFERYMALYAATARARGANPRIGPSLAALLIDAGFKEVEVSISMPVFRTGEGKSIARLTLANIAEAAIATGLAQAAEIKALASDLARHEADPRSIQSTAQIFQVIGLGPTT